MEGLEKRARKTWQDLAASEMRIWMLRELLCLEVGLNDVEVFGLNLVKKFRSEAMKTNSEKIEKKLVR